jgi:hypothetical protein
MPMPAISRGPCTSQRLIATAIRAAQISCVVPDPAWLREDLMNSCWPTPTIAASWSKTMARELVP